MKENYIRFYGDFLEDTVENLAELHFIIEKEEIKPYEDMTGSGRKRVIEIRSFNTKKVKIIWSYEDYN